MERTRRRIAQATLLPIALVILLAGAAVPASAAAPVPAPYLQHVWEQPISLNW